MNAIHHAPIRRVVEPCALIFALLAAAAPDLAAQPAAPALTASAPTRTAPSEAEFLVPPGGGAFEVPVHAGAVCILSFPEKMAASALTSSADFEIKAWGDDGVAVRANSRATTSTLALATISGSAKVNVTFRVVPARDAALTLVRFKAASLVEAFEAKVSAEVERRLAPLRAELAATQARLDETVRTRADGLIAERLLQRDEAQALSAHERNDDHVILHVERSLLLGDDGYLFFSIENRSAAAYRLATVAVLRDGQNVAGPARLSSATLDQDPTTLGVVAAGATARGVVVVRDATLALRRPLTLELAEPQGRGKLRLDRGLALK